MQSLQLLDYHMHTGVTVDSRMEEGAACEKALAVGLREIAFTNHVMLKQADYLTAPEVFVAHWKKIQACQQRYPGLTIRLGIEIDYYPGWERQIETALRTTQEALGRPFDLVIGAIHELNDIFFSNPKYAPQLYQSKALPQLYEDYFAVSSDAARSGFFDLLAHPDLIKRFVHDLTPPLAFDAYRHAAASFVEALLESEVGIDFNMKGLKLKVGEQFPSTDLLDLYLGRAREKGLRPILTLGSDAHAAEDVGSNLEIGARLLIEHGQHSLTRFELRQRFDFPMLPTI